MLQVKSASHKKTETMILSYEVLRIVKWRTVSGEILSNRHRISFCEMKRGLWIDDGYGRPEM